MKKKIKSDINIEQNLDELLKILICPKTGSKLLFDKEKNELISKKGKLAYPISCLLYTSDAADEV